MGDIRVSDRQRKGSPMKRALRFAGNLLWALAGLAILLILLYFVLHAVRTRTPAPIANAAALVERGLQPPTA